MPYSDPKAIWMSSFTCFWVFRASVPFGEQSPNMAQIPQIMVREIPRAIQSLQFIISHQMMPDSNRKAIWRSTLTCFRVFGALVQFGETGCKYGPNTANHGYRDTKSHLRVYFDLFWGIWGISAIWGSLAQIELKYCKSWLQRHEK